MAFITHRVNIEPYNKKPNTTKLGSIFNLNMMSDILDGSHYQKSQKWLYNSQSQNGDLEQKPNTTQFGSIIKLNMMSTILDAGMFEI